MKAGTGQTLVHQSCRRQLKLKLPERGRVGDN